MAGPKANAHYEAVRDKIADGTPAGEAIRAVAEAAGTTAGTVSTNYYRVLREQGKGQVVTTRAGEVTSDELLRQAVDALTALARRAEANEKDLERLRRIERALNDT